MTEPAGQAELVVTCETIRAFDDESRVVDAVGIADGTVVAAGSRAEVEAAALPGAARLDLPGGAVLPGFCDTHMHFEKIAAELQMLQLGGAHSVSEVLELVAEAVRRTEPGEWIQAFGDDNAWHEERLAEQRLPTRTELDAVARAHPVYLYRGQDAAALNSAAIAQLDSTLAEADWEPSTGWITSSRARALQEELPPPRDRRPVLESAAQTLLGFGVTTIVDPGLPAAFDATWDLYAQCAIPQRLYVMDRLDHRRDFDGELRRAGASRPASVGDRLLPWGLKLLVDGEFANAWMRDGEVQPQPPARRYSPAQLRAALALAAELGLPICFHVMGGGAIDVVIAAVRAAGGGEAFARNQVSLAHVFLPSQRNLEDCAELGIALSVHPMLSYVFEREMLDAWGAAAHAANPTRTMLELGLDVAGGSDVLPCEPLRGAAVAATRRGRLDSTLGADQALPPEDAISLFTGRAGTYVQRPLLGTLAVGAPADLVWWPEDPLRLAPADWGSLRASAVVVGGELVYEA